MRPEIKPINLILTKMKKIVFGLMAVATLVLVGCKNDSSSNGGKTLNSIVANYGDTINFADTLGVAEVEVIPADYYYADVDEDGLVIVGHVGKTTLDVIAEGKTQKVALTIEPTYADEYFYPTFNCDWTLTEAALRQQMGTPGYDTTYNDTTVLVYQVSQLFYGQYYFVNNKFDMLECLTANSTLGQYSLYYLLERFQYYGQNQGYYFFINALTREEANTVITFANMGGYYWNVYQPNTPAGVTAPKRMPKKLVNF